MSRISVSESLHTEINPVVSSDELKTEFEPVNQQHHLALFHRVANSQIRKIVLIALLNVIILGVFAGVLFVLVFLGDKSPHSNDKEGTSTTVAQLTSTTVTQLTSTTVKSFSPSYPDGCTPSSSKTFLFAYSNDLPYGLIDNARGYIMKFVSNKKIVCFANRRFDSTNDVIHYHKSRQEMSNSVTEFMPDSKLQFPSRENGSDVLSLIRSFLTNEECPLCGAIVYIVMKRYPNQEDTSDLIQQLRQHHIFVNTVTDTTPSGGSEQSLMCEITRATNGFCDFQATVYMNNDVYQTIYELSRVYQIVTRSYKVSGRGNVTTPPFIRPFQKDETGPMSIVITFQDHGRDSNFQSSNYLIVDNYGNVSASNMFKDIDGNSKLDHPILENNVPYQIIVNYVYRSNKKEVLEVKMYSSFPVDSWLPYPDF